MKLLIDIDNTPNQTFTADLGGKVYDFHLVYKYLLDAWVLSCSQNGTSIFDGVGVEVGVNIVGSLGIVGFGGLYLEGVDATRDNLGTHNKLIWVSP